MLSQSLLFSRPLEVRIWARLTTLAASFTRRRKFRHAQFQSLFFSLPAEIRVMVHHHALCIETEASDLDPYTFVIGDRRVLRSWSYAQHTNLFSHVNFDSKRFSLVNPCTRVRAEVKKLVPPKSSFRFLSSDALGKFLGFREREHIFDEDVDARLENHDKQALDTITSASGLSMQREYFSSL